MVQPPQKSLTAQKYFLVMQKILFPIFSCRITPETHYFSRLLGQNNVIRPNASGGKEDLTFHCKLHPGLLRKGNLFGCAAGTDSSDLHFSVRAACNPSAKSEENFILFPSSLSLYSETNLQENSLHGLSDGIYHSIQLPQLAALLAVTPAR